MPPPFLRLTAFAADRAPAAEVLCLPFDLRCKSRLMTRLASGREALLVLPRGRIMRGGDQLLASEGTRVEVVAADERVADITAADARELARIAYHLGNRHVAVQIEPGRLRIAADHVLEAMVAGLGGRLEHCEAPFEPEGGAYAAHEGRHVHPHHAHDHHHGGNHAHGHAQDHDHGQDHVDGHDSAHDRGHDGGPGKIHSYG